VETNVQLYPKFSSDKNAMSLKVLQTSSLAGIFLAELRDVHQQGDRLRFRRNLERLGQIMAYEISQTLPYKDHMVQTPLAHASGVKLEASVVLVSILRAGLPYFQGFQSFFDRADSGFIGAYRKEEKEIVIQLDYLAAPTLEGKTLILIDPMLATGKSIVQSYQQLLSHGNPTHIHIASLIAAPEGIAYIDQYLTSQHTLWTFSVDQRLDENLYIVPGLGDAGDLSFGNKH
jgi:uracil phosphoribosyltransferase